jgi:hypothetical protein
MILKEERFVHTLGHELDLHKLETIVNHTKSLGAQKIIFKHDDNPHYPGICSIEYVTTDEEIKPLIKENKHLQPIKDMYDSIMEKNSKKHELIQKSICPSRDYEVDKISKEINSLHNSMVMAAPMIGGGTGCYTHSDILEKYDSNLKKIEMIKK